MPAVGVPPEFDWESVGEEPYEHVPLPRHVDEAREEGDVECGDPPDLEEIEGGPHGECDLHVAVGKVGEAVKDGEDPGAEHVFCELPEALLLGGLPVGDPRGLELSSPPPPQVEEDSVGGEGETGEKEAQNLLKLHISSRWARNYKGVTGGIEKLFSRCARDAIFHPHLAEYILDRAEYEAACLEISSGSPFLFGESQGNLYSSDNIPLDLAVSCDVFSRIPPLLASTSHNPRLNSSYPNDAVQMSVENVVYIGSKPLMNYCLAVLTSLKDGEGRVALKARGRAISTAVDVAEVTKNRFMENLKVENVEIGTEELESEGRMRNVSTITIILKK